MIGTCRQCELYLRELLQGDITNPQDKKKKKYRGEKSGIPSSISGSESGSISSLSSSSSNSNETIRINNNSKNKSISKSRIQNLLEAIEAEGYTVKTQFKTHVNESNHGSGNIINTNSSSFNKSSSSSLITAAKNKADSPHEEETRGLFRGLLLNKLTTSFGTLIQSSMNSSTQGIENKNLYDGKIDHIEKTFLVQCRQCEDYGAIGGARAYVQAPPLSLNLCYNRLSSKKEMEESLVHELIHVYDHIVANRDLRDCQQLAYSEIRAAREAECSEYFRGEKFLCSWFRQWCVKTTAIKATSSLFPNEATKCVNQVFEKAYYDTSPFPKTEVPQSIFHHIPYLKLSIPTTYTPSSIPNRTQQEQQQQQAQTQDIPFPSSSSSPSAAAVSTSKVLSPSSKI